MKDKNLILLLTPPTESNRTAEENLGLGYLAAILRNNNYDVIIKDCWVEKISINGIISLIKLYKKDLLFIGISCYRSSIENTFTLSKGIKEVDNLLPIIVGGFGPTFYIEDFINQESIDIVVKGEAEETIIELANAIKENLTLNAIKGISFKYENTVIHNEYRKHVKDINTIPFPSRDAIDVILNRKSSVNILTSRGCMASCIFCSIIAFQRLADNEKWRQRTISNFVDEVEFLYKNHNVLFFKVIDDSLIEPPRDAKWCKDLYEELSTRNINAFFRGSIRADRLSDDILYYLKKCGFISFSCGIENGSASALKRMGKSAKLNDNILALNLFKKHTILVQSGMILFDDKTTYQEIVENYNFLNNYRWGITKGIFTEMYAAEGTPFSLKLKKSNNLEQETELKTGNSVYKIKDPIVKKIYYCLKEWHKSHSFIYDMIIDPISAPKALLPENLMLYYNLYSKLQEKDLYFFDFIIKNSLHYDLDSLLEKTQQYIFNLKDFYRNLQIETELLNMKCGLIYDASINPFIC